MVVKKTSIEELLGFLNKCSIEPSLMWTIPHLYDKKTQYEVQWVFSKVDGSNFYIKKVGESEWSQMDAKELVRFMSIEKIDLTYFEFQLLKVICVQAVCSHYYIERAGELIGKDRIEAAIKIITDFAENKAQETQEIKENVPRLKLVKKKKKDHERQ